MILDFGYLCMEIHSQTAVFPAQGQTLQSSNHSIRPAGRAATTAIAAARMGAKVSVIGTTGVDLFGKSIIDSLRREGIATSGIASSANPSGIIQSITTPDHQTTRIMNIGANIETKAAQIPDRALNIRTLLLIHDDMSAEENNAILTRARAQNAKIMMLASATPPPGTLVDLDYLVCANAPTQKDFQGTHFTPPNPQPRESEIYCGILAAALQSNMPAPEAENFTHRALSFARGEHDPYPYLGDLPSQP